MPYLIIVNCILRGRLLKQQN